MISTLQIQRDIVAQEGFLDMGANVGALVAKVFPTVAGAFANFVAGFSTSQPAVAVSSKQKDFLAKLKIFSYIDLMDMMVFTPEGMNPARATYLDYGMALSGAVDYALNVEKTLNDYTTYLSKLIMNVDQKKSSQNSQRVFKEMEKSRAKINATLATYYTPGSFATETHYKEMIKRHADWEPVFDLCNKLAIAVESIPRTQLLNKVAETSKLMDKIIAMIAKKEIEGMSPEALQELSDGAFQVASELEFFSAMHYRTIAFVEAVNRTVIRLNTVLAK